MARLAGKVALITGAAGGQGVAEAELFVREGAAVMLTDLDAAKGEALATRLRARCAAVCRAPPRQQSRRKPGSVSQPA
jgi:3alpha(or 20beta)-hydroxysteroid dehydrogenase